MFCIIIAVHILLLCSVLLLQLITFHFFFKFNPGRSTYEWPLTNNIFPKLLLNIFWCIFRFYLYIVQFIMNILLHNILFVGQLVTRVSAAYCTKMGMLNAWSKFTIYFAVHKIYKEEIG